MAVKREYRTHEVWMDSEEQAVVHSSPEHGPVVSVTVDQYGIIGIECEGRRLRVVTIDPGPGGIQVFVEGPHVDGQP